LKGAPSTALTGAAAAIKGGKTGTALENSDVLPAGSVAVAVMNCVAAS